MIECTHCGSSDLKQDGEWLICVHCGEAMHINGEVKKVFKQTTSEEINMSRENRTPFKTFIILLLVLALIGAGLFIVNEFYKRDNIYIEPQLGSGEVTENKMSGTVKVVNDCFYDIEPKISFVILDKSRHVIKEFSEVEKIYANSSDYVEITIYKSDFEDINEFTSEDFGSFEIWLTHGLTKLRIITANNTTI